MNDTEKEMRRESKTTTPNQAVTLSEFRRSSRVTSLGMVRPQKPAHELLPLGVGACVGVEGVHTILNSKRTGNFSDI